MDVDENKKIANGQFFTKGNPFIHPAFINWYDSIPDDLKGEILEPFTGTNNIPRMLHEIGIDPLSWYAIDIDLTNGNTFPEVEIHYGNILEKYPDEVKAHIGITNPPYLAKNSAKRQNIPFLYPKYDDLYKYCLEVMLNHLDYVAAIIPESFVNANLFMDRLSAIISLNIPMFDDTDAPVCLALFSKDETDDVDFYTFTNPKKIGTFQTLSKFIPVSKCNFPSWKVNDPNGSIGVYCIDSPSKANIHFCKGDLIDPSKIKYTSRSLTRVGGFPDNLDIDDFINKANEILKDYRNNTHDIFLTPFKGLRKDGVYRRRLDFNTMKHIMSEALSKMMYNKI